MTKKLDKHDIKLKKYLSNIDHMIVIANGLSEAFVGLINTPDGLVTVYDKARVVHILKKKNKWSQEEAEEYADFNIFSEYVYRSPLFIDRVDVTDWSPTKE